MIILNTRSPYAILTVLAVMIAVAFGYWTFITSGEKFVTLKKHNELWQRNEPDSYSYSIYNGCMYVQKSEVTVLFGNITFNDTDEDDTPLGNIKIENLFATINKAQARAYSIVVEYNTEYGYPESIKVDWDKTTMDDECFYVVKEFQDLS